MAKVVERYFYGVDHPHSWSVGMRVHTHDPDDWTPIRDIDHARELAQKYRKGTPGHEDYVKTTYGVYFEEEPNEDSSSV